jgi:hypothetical protein
MFGAVCPARQIHDLIHAWKDSVKFRDLIGISTGEALARTQACLSCAPPPLALFCCGTGDPLSPLPPSSMHMCCPAGGEAAHQIHATLAFLTSSGKRPEELTFNLKRMTTLSILNIGVSVRESASPCACAAFSALGRLRQCVPWAAFVLSLLGTSAWHWLAALTPSPRAYGWACARGCVADPLPVL